MLHFFGRHAPVVYAVSFTVVALVIGTYLSWTRTDASLNRAGALIIVAGILLGASRFYDWVEQKFAGFVNAKFDDVANDALQKIESKIGQPLTLQQREEVKRSARTSLHADVAAILGEDRSHLKKWELWLIVGGTILNGFGDLLVQGIKGSGV